jgi:hypothetical protein
VLDGIRLFELKALQSSDRPLLGGGPKFAPQSPCVRSETQSGNPCLRRFRVAVRGTSPPYLPLVAA